MVADHQGREHQGGIAASLGCVLTKTAIGDSDLINFRFGPLYGLKSDISRGPRSADSVAKVGGMAALIYRRCFLSLFLICEA
jgi:hypothetical protein